MGIVCTLWVCIAENTRWKTGVLTEDIAAILLCTTLYLHSKSSHTFYVQYKRVSSMFFNVLFYMGKVHTVCVCIAENARWKTGVLSEDIAAILLCTALYLQPKVPMHSMLNIKEFHAGFSTFYFAWEICSKFAFSLQRMRVERRVFYPKISQRSCNVQHCTCTQKVAMHCMFNIKEVQACFSTLYYTFSNCILHWNSAYSVGFHCRKCALKEGCFIGWIRNDSAI